MKNHAKSTQCVHAGALAPSTGSGLVTPIYPSTAYDYIDAAVLAYPRYFNTPNQKVVADKIAQLEDSEVGITFSSGMAAISTVLFSFLKQGQHAVFQNDLYGGTYHAINIEMEKFGISRSFVDIDDIEGFEAALRPETKLIYIESPSNPLLKIVDIRAIARLAKKKGILTIIDNTFATPINQNPIAMGIDIVIHSGTKYLGGHSDLSCGAIVTSRTLAAPIMEAALHFGGNLNADTCYLLERSLKTLALRVDRQNANALALAKYLESHDKVGAVHYPGLESHSQHSLAKSQMRGFGGMLSFELKTETGPFLKQLNLIRSAMSLGGVETTICVPAETSHVKLSKVARAAVGVSDGLLRLSTGIEDSHDLIEDIEVALSK